MSQDTRTTALIEAVKTARSGGVTLGVPDIIEIAEVYEAFLNADVKSNQINSTPAEEPARVADVKVSKATKGKKDKVVEEVEAEAEEQKKEVIPTKEEIAKAIVKLISGGRRDEAVKILKMFNANSVSGIKEADYAAVYDMATEA